MPLDIPTLFIISTCVTAVLGLFLLFAWIQDRSIRALAWWGAAYLIGGLAAALWGMHEVVARAVTVDIVYALLFVACGIIWTGRGCSTSGRCGRSGCSAAPSCG